MPGWDVSKTGDYIHYRVNDPDKYIQIRQEEFGKGQGIFVRIGFFKGGGSEVQALLFLKSKWTLDKAKAWVNEHQGELSEIVHGHFEETDNVPIWTFVKDSKFDPDAAFEIFQTGKYPQGEFTQEDLDEIVNNFEPQYHTPPLVIDHKEEGQAHGWVKELWRKGDSLFARITEWSKDVWEGIKSGAFKKFSIGLYPNFEGKGWAMAHLSILGAAPPQVKGMDFPFKADSYETRFNKYGKIICFSDFNWEAPIESFVDDEREKNKQQQETRSKRYSIGIKDDRHVTKGDQEVTEKEVQEMLSKTKEEIRLDFSDKLKQSDEKVSVLTEQIKAKDNEIVALRDQNIKTEINTFGEAMLKEGKITPAEWKTKETVLFQMAKLGIKTRTEDKDGKEIEILLYEQEKQMIRDRMPQVPLNEIVKNEMENKAKVVRFYQKNPEYNDIPESDLDLAEKANEIEKRDKVDYKEAICRAQRESANKQ